MKGGKIIDLAAQVYVCVFSNLPRGREGDMEPISLVEGPTIQSSQIQSQHHCPRVIHLTSIPWRSRIFLHDCFIAA